MNRSRACPYAHPRHAADNTSVNRVYCFWLYFQLLTVGVLATNVFPISPRTARLAVAKEWQAHKAGMIGDQHHLGDQDLVRDRDSYISTS